MLIFLKLFAKIPNYLLYYLLKPLSWLACLAKSSPYRIAQINITHCYPELDKKSQQQLIKRSIFETFYGFCEIPRIWLQPTKPQQKRILSITGTHFFNEALKQNHSILFLVPHLGSWEIFGVWLKTHQQQIHVLFKPPHLKSLTDIMVNGRKQHGAQTYPTNSKGVSQLCKRFKEKKIIGLLPDQTPKPENSIKSPFFSIPAYTGTLPAKLIDRFAPTTLFFTAIREKHHGYHIHIKPFTPSNIDTDQPKSQQIALITEQINQMTEQLIALEPSQYQWSYKRYRYISSVKYPK